MRLHIETLEGYKKRDMKRPVPRTLSPGELTTIFERPSADPDELSRYLKQRFEKASSHLGERHDFATFAIFGRRSVMVEDMGTSIEHVVDPVLAKAVVGGLASTLFESKHPIPRPLEVRKSAA